MNAYYNEHNTYAAQWLRQLIADGTIPAGDVDERDIRDVRPDDLDPYQQCHFFAGIGGWGGALRLAGAVDGARLWTGSCPCQPFSAAGARAGFADERHLWPAFFHLIRVCRPGIVFGEQVASPDGLLWLDLVQDDMEGEDYALGAPDLCAAGVGAWQARQRLYWLAYTEDSDWWREQPAGEPWRRRDGFAGGIVGPMASPDRAQFQHQSPARQQSLLEQDRGFAFWADTAWVHCRDGLTRPIEPGTFPLAYGLPAGAESGCSELERLAVRAARTYRVGTTRGYGNAILRQLGAEFILAGVEAMSGMTLPRYGYEGDHDG